MKRNGISVSVLLMLLTWTAYAEVPRHVQYIFPKDGAVFIARSTNIIIRPGAAVDPAALHHEAFISVQGSKSGTHQGRLVLAGDQRSILFYPETPFESDEAVSVQVRQPLKSAKGDLIQPFSFRFRTTPLDRPVNPYDHLTSLTPQLPRGGGLKKADAMPDFDVTVTGETAPGQLFLAPTQFFSADGYLLMTNDNGDVLYEQEIDGKVPFDFKLQPNGQMSYGLLYEYFAFSGGGYTDFYTMDSTFSVTDEFQMGNGYIADFHDFQYLPNGHCLLFAYDFQPVDMSEIVEGGRPDALVAGSIIQELDLQKNVVFQWRSWDYFDLTDSYNDLMLKNFDAIHINSLDVANDGNLIVSVLALGEVTKINRQTGEIMWRLGGKNNQFTFIGESEEFAPLYFMFQHDVRCLPGGHITMFDNGAAQFGREYSRVVEYALDETAMTATKVWEYRHDPDIFVPTMGNAQRLPNGNTLIGWGFASLRENVPLATEVDAEGNVVMEMTCEDGFGSYRVFRYPYDGGKPSAEVTLFEVQEGNTYEFENGDVNLGLTIEILQKPGFGYNEILGYRFDYGPEGPDFPGQAPHVVPMHFVLYQYAIDQISFDLIFDTEFLELENPENLTIYWRQFDRSGGMFFGRPTTYNPVTGELKATVSRYGIGNDDPIGEFILVYTQEAADMLPPVLSYPRDNSSVNQLLPVQFAWSAQGYANYFDFQLSEDSLFASLIVDEFDLMESTYSLETLDPETRYYWRVRASTDLDTSDWSAASFNSVVPFIDVTSPAEGDMWNVGLKYFIEWEDNLDEDVILQLFNNNQLQMVIDTVQSIGAFRWETPFNVPLGDQYQIRVQSAADASLFGMSSSFAIDTSGTSQTVVTEYHLYQNAPNPVLNNTVIQYDLPVECRVTLEVYNLLGQRVAVLLDDAWIGQGQQQFSWQPGARGSGLYFYRMHAKPLEAGSEYPEYRAMRKMTLLN